MPMAELFVIVIASIDRRCNISLILQDIAHVLISFKVAILLRLHPIQITLVDSSLLYAT